MKSKDEAAPTHEMIADRAYQRYVERGMQDGHDLEDWIAAETELRTAVSAPAAAPTPPTPRPGKGRQGRGAESRS